MAPIGKEGWIPWRKSATRALIVSELESGGIPLTHAIGVTAEDVWSKSKDHETVVSEKVVKEQFLLRLRDHQKQVAIKKQCSSREEIALRHDLAMHPPLCRNALGRPFWNGSDAQNFLEQDVFNRVYERMHVGLLYLSRPEYQEFPMRLFRHHLYQEIKRQKFICYLEMKRAQKLATKQAKDQTRSS